VPNELASATSQTQANVNVRRTELGVIVVDETQIMTQTKLIGQEQSRPSNCARARKYSAYAL
jgi:hypothetical protein